MDDEMFCILVISAVLHHESMLQGGFNLDLSNVPETVDLAVTVMIYIVSNFRIVIVAF